MKYLAKYSNSPIGKVNTDYAETTLDELMSSYFVWKGRVEQHGKLKVCPMQEAIWFYWHNHLVRSVEMKFGRFESLPDNIGKAVDRYYAEGSLKILRMVYYMVMITIREARHCKRNRPEYLAVKSKYEPQYDEIIRNIVGSGGGAVMTYLQEGEQIPADIKLGTLFRFLHEIFSVKALWTGGYGGKAWANVVYPLTMMFNGKISPEIVMDTAFTLAHNNGPIFNKGVLFKNYDAALIIKILDVQNSGQIPQYIGMESNSGVNPKVSSYNKQVAKEIGGIYVQGINWHKVIGAGAKGNYSSLASGQPTECSSTGIKQHIVPLPTVETWKLYGENEYTIIDRGEM